MARVFPLVDVSDISAYYGGAMGVPITSLVDTIPSSPQVPQIRLEFLSDTKYEDPPPSAPSTSRMMRRTKADTARSPHGQSVM